jgi:hypothetical protein
VTPLPQGERELSPINWATTIKKWKAEAFLYKKARPILRARWVYRMGTSAKILDWSGATKSKYQKNLKGRETPPLRFTL